MKDCGNCFWWRGNRAEVDLLRTHTIDKVEIEEVESGSCVCRAPTIVIGMLEGYVRPGATLEEALAAYWPETDADEYCGDHKPI